MHRMVLSPQIVAVLRAVVYVFICKDLLAWSPGPTWLPSASCAQRHTTVVISQHALGIEDEKSAAVGVANWSIQICFTLVEHAMHFSFRWDVPSIPVILH